MHDTFGRLFRLIKPEQFEAVLAGLARRVTAEPAGPVAADGKSNEITALPELLGLSRGHLHWVLDVTMREDASLVRRGHGPRHRTTPKRVALNAVRIVTGKNSLRHTMRDAVLDVRVLAHILNHMPVA